MLVAVIQLRGQMPSFPLRRRERTYLPILERIPPALGERCHRLETSKWLQRNDVVVRAARARQLIRCSENPILKTFGASRQADMGGNR